MNKKPGYTLTELLITVIILSIVAAFGYPSFSNSQKKAVEKDAVYNLRVIREAVNLYRTREDDTTLADQGTTIDINTAFNLAIIELEGTTYSCVTDVADIYICTAQEKIDTWRLSFKVDENNGEVYCSNGVCPSCTGAGCPY